MLAKQIGISMPFHLPISKIASDNERRYDDAEAEIAMPACE